MAVLKPSIDNLYIKPLHRDIIRQVAELEKFSQENFWTERDIAKLMRNPRITGWVMSKGTQQIGYMVFECIQSNKEIHILNLVIHPKFRRMGLAGRFFKRLALYAKRGYCTIYADVRESNLRSQLLLKKHDFFAYKIGKCYFKDEYADRTHYEDAYQFRRTLDATNEAICRRTSRSVDSSSAR